MAADIPTNKTNIGCGLFAAAMGAFIMAGAGGLFGIDLHPTDEAPRWVGICAGAIFLAGGLAVAVQSLGAARPAPDGGLTPDSPLWARRISFALCLVIVGSFAAVFLWIAVGPGPRHFSTSASFGGFHASGTSSGETFGRVIFGFGAVFACLMFVAFLVSGVRGLLRRDPG